MVGVQVSSDSEKLFLHENLEELTKVCSDFYRKSIENVVDSSEVFERRAQLLQWIRKFHEECGTVTPHVEEAIQKLKDSSCLLLMTAHQPNLFAYSGVLRKATLNHALAERLSESLSLPVVCLFGVADQDFTDDRWVRSAILPDPKRRDGVLELRIDLPEKLMLNKVAKPSRQVLNRWRSKIESWFSTRLSSIERSFKSLGIEFDQQKLGLSENFEDFWATVDESCERARNYSDFNAFLMSEIVNITWGYDALFFRFSECQQIFEREFCFLLSHFEDYSRYVKEVTFSSGVSKGGVYKQEFNTIPFWYHCDCGSKARLLPEQHVDAFFGRGECLGCGKEYKIDFSSREEPEVSGILPRISIRSLAMPLVFFDGLGVCCYVGGVGGSAYLGQAKYVGERMGIAFPPVVIWRPRDVYLGVGQLEALITFKELSGTFDLSQYEKAEANLKHKISDVEKKIQELELQKDELADDAKIETAEKIKRMKAISVRKYDIRKENNFPVLARNLKLLQNVKGAMSLHPCIVDYAVNIGLDETSEQWLTFLRKNGSLSSSVDLRTSLDDVFSFIRHQLNLA